MLSFFAKGGMEMTMLRNVELTETLHAIMRATRSTIRRITRRTCRSCCMGGSGIICS